MADPTYGSLIDANDAAVYNARQQGVFALHPLATPKYAVNRGLRDAEFKESLARIYISLSDVDETTKKLYLQSLPGDAATQNLARVLVGPDPRKGIQTGFIDFLLQQAQESFNEKVQIDEVLGDNYVAFFFGQSPPVFQYSGMLINSQQDDQRTGFAVAYQQLLRGTALARHGALARLRYDSVIVSGTMLSHTQVINAENELAVPFSFSFLVKEYVIRTDPKFSKKTVEDFVQLSTAFASDAVLQKVGGASDARVRTTLVTPTVLSAESVAGSEQDVFVVDESQPAPQQLEQKYNQARQPPSPTAAIRGTVAATPDPPPPAFAAGL